MEAWPQDYALGTGEALWLRVGREIVEFGRPEARTLAVVQRAGRGWSERYVSIHESAQGLRFVPHPGERPRLVLLEPRVLCPAHSHHVLHFALPLTVRAGVRDAQGVTHVQDFAPGPSPKALYGPLDQGIICQAVRAQVSPAQEVLETRLMADPEQPWLYAPLRERPSLQGGEGGPWEAIKLLVAAVAVQIFNDTDSALEVSKIMLPSEPLALFDRGGQLVTNEVRMRLLSPNEAEVQFGDAPDAQCRPVGTLQSPGSGGDRGRPLIFTHVYRQKTGLEYGF